VKFGHRSSCSDGVAEDCTAVVTVEESGDTSTVTRIGLLLTLLVAVALAVPASGTGRANWRTHRIGRIHAALDLPASWRNVNHRTPALQSLLERLARDNPELAPAIRALRPTGPVVFIAVDLKSKKFLTNLSVIRQSSPGLSLAGIRKTLVKELRTSGKVAGAIAARIVRTRAGKALEVRYIYRGGFVTQPVTGAATQYLLLRKRTLYMLTYSTSRLQRAAYRTVFASSGRSFRFTG
jgi:hypothetical protein